MEDPHPAAKGAWGGAPACALRGGHAGGEQLVTAVSIDSIGTGAQTTVVVVAEFLSPPQGRQWEGSHAGDGKVGEVSKLHRAVEAGVVEERDVAWAGIRPAAIRISIDGQIVETGLTAKAAELEDVLA